MAKTNADDVIHLIANSGTLISAGLLSKLIHSAVGVDARARDLSENENIDRYMSLTGIKDKSFASYHLVGAFKPLNFVHIFDDYYSIAGYDDERAITALSATINSRFADEIGDSLIELLAFIYVSFLVVHPFVDGNGRVARGLLDYYSILSGNTVAGSWNNTGFAQHALHKSAFKAFFKDEAQVSSLKSLGLNHPFPIHPDLTSDLTKLADVSVSWFNEVEGGLDFASRQSVRDISQLIKLSQ